MKHLHDALKDNYSYNEDTWNLFILPAINDANLSGIITITKVDSKAISKQP